ncbi:MAG: FecR family protein [Tannerellaceae bacterium]|jgi:ferric-dicitrate binding protein FerR (iron transport regulator)|nr:FecR family protein [Tannerellaceae bacterium]
MNDLLEKYFAGELNNDEKRELFRALKNDPALMQEYVRMQHIMAVSGMVSREGDKQWSNRKLNEIWQQSPISKRRKLIRSALKYVAVIILLVCTWLFAMYYSGDDSITSVAYTHVEVPKGQYVFLTLPDGSQAWLSSRSTLRFSNQFNIYERCVELDGEGFFSVQKNERIPFVVHTKEYNIEVTGTQFNVFAYSTSSLFETDLIEGSVSIYGKNDKAHKIDLLPEQKVVLSDGKFQKATSNVVRPGNIRNGIYSFEDLSFQEIKKRLELWYDVKIHIAKPEVLSYTFSGKFRQSDNIDLILQAIKETGQFDFIIQENNEIEIY